MRASVGQALREKRKKTCSDESEDRPPLLEGSFGPDRSEAGAQAPQPEGHDCSDDPRGQGLFHNPRGQSLRPGSHEYFLKTLAERDVGLPNVPRGVRSLSEIESEGA